tara:strand:- start:55 stop:1137 length:1083 start_codon:yes stop_codon:yes gene_type:complete
MSKLKIAIAGFGFGEKVHIPAVRDSDHFELKYLYHHNKNKIDHIEKITGIKCYGDWNSIVTSDIEGVIIATPPEVRYQLAKEALVHGKNILLEKPVALKSEEIQNLQRIAISSNLSVCVDFEYRAVPLFMQTKKLLDKNKLGKIHLVKLDWLMSSRSDPSREWNWYSLSEKGGGVIGALGTHAFDILHWFFGKTTEVSAKTYTSIKERPKANQLLKVTSEDICIANIKLSNHPEEIIPCQVSLSSISKNGRGFCLEIYGSEGTLFLRSENQKDYVHGFNLTHIDNLDKVLTINPNDEFLFERTWSDGRIAPVKRIHDWWANSIIDKKPIVPGLSEGLNSQRVCEAAKESSESGIASEITH